MSPQSIVIPRLPAHSGHAGAASNHRHRYGAMTNMIFNSAHRGGAAG
jgi:hypothetical protein